ncbi:MAG TPA: hypothetical protein VKP69_05330 [Isosphaeraceae bacterium]|nr:hypothetical protein [Isosphaeraceae bacterium]
MSDDYLLDAAWEHWDQILRIYRPFEKLKPIVLFDIQEQRIYLYPYEDFREELKPKDQDSLQDQYERAISANKITVFVRDNVERRLVSYSLDYEIGNAAGSRAWRKRGRKGK